MAFKNYYDILGIDSTASTQQIREAYRNALNKYKSETNEGDEFLGKMLKNINEAVEVLSDPEKKKQYDKTLTILDAATDVTVNQTSKPTSVNIDRSDAERISELIKKYFEQERLLREKKDLLLAAQAAKPVRYFTFLKVLLCAIIIGVAFYFHSPQHFEFDFERKTKKNFTYEYYTIDTTLIYSRPSIKKSKVLKGVSKGTGFNVIEETTYFFKIAYLDEKGRNIEGYIKKEQLEKNVEIPF